MIKLGEINISSVKLGDSNISKVYQGEALIFGGGQPPIEAKLPDDTLYNYRGKNFSEDLLGIKTDKGSTGSLNFLGGSYAMNGNYLTLSNNPQFKPAIQSNIFNIFDSEPALTIMFSAYPDSNTNNSSDIISNRSAESNYNYMLRNYTGGTYLHGLSNYQNYTLAENDLGDVIMLQVDENSVAKLTNVTKGISTEEFNVQWGESSTNYTMFYANYSSQNVEHWSGEFGWIFCCKRKITEEEIQQVIAFNSK